MQMMSNNSEQFVNNDVDGGIEELLMDGDIELLLADENEERMIKYNTFIACKKDDELKRISFNDIDNYNFEENGFIEFLVSEDYVHLYFDFDSIKSDNEFNDILNWLSDLTETFGHFSIGGYTNDEFMSNSYGFRLFPEGNHFLSIHVVFPDSRISTKDLVMIMKHDSKKGFLTQGVHQQCDPNVYKLVSRNSENTVRQAMSHVLSDKIYSIGSDKNVMNHGVILDGDAPSRQIIQIRGDELIVTKSDWEKYFKVPSEEKSTSTKSNPLDVDAMYSNLNAHENQSMCFFIFFFIYWYSAKYKTMKNIITTDDIIKQCFIFAKQQTRKCEMI